MSIGNTTENDICLLLFNGTALSWNSNTDLYVSLHTADPGEGGNQTTSEATYTSYARVAVARTSGGWTVSSNTATSPLLTIPYSGTGSGKFGPFFPLQNGDAGIQSIQNIILGTAGVTTGVYNLVYCRPLFTLPMTTVGVAAERDLVNQLPSMPRVYDGACLGILLYAGAAVPNNSSFFGHIDFGWGA